jgi:hypothetical protein
MRLSEGGISAILQLEIDQAQGYDSDVLAVKREQALKYYQGEMPDAAEGRSNVVSTDLADAQHGTLAMVQPILKSTIIEFVPDGDQDEQAAQMESDFTRDQMDKAGGWTAIFEAVHDALLIGNGWLKCSTEDVVAVTEESYPPDLDETSLFVLSQPTAENQEVKVTAGATSTNVKRTTTTTKLLFESIDPADMLFSEGHGISSLQKQRFVAERKLYTCATLSEMGISDQVISELPDGDNDWWQASEARQGIYGNDDGQAAQDSERLKELFDCYINISMSGNNDSELRHILYGGGHVLTNEPVTHVPYVTGSAVPMPHRVQGTGLFEMLAQVQESKTSILRNYLDNLEVLNGSRMGVVEGSVNLDDATNGRINGIVRCRSADAIFPLPAADIGAQALQGLEYQDQIRVQRVGSALDFNEAQAQIMSSSATAAAGQLGQAEKQTGWYATNLVETLLKPAFAACHRLLRTEIAGPVMAKSRGQWAEQDTSQWPEREVLEVTMGMTTGEKAHRINALAEVVMQQTQLAMQGGSGTLVDKSKVYNALADWNRANDLGSPEQYWVDPDSPEAQQMEQQTAQQQAQQAQQMQQREDELAQREIDFELEKQRRDLEYKRWSDELDAEVDEAKLTASTVVDMRKIEESAKNDKASTGN